MKFLSILIKIFSIFSLCLKVNHRLFLSSRYLLHFHLREVFLYSLLNLHVLSCLSQSSVLSLLLDFPILLIINRIRFLRPLEDILGK